jgi:hypothetical protein
VKERTDGQNSLWGICEVPPAVRSHEGEGELRQVFLRGSISAEVEP